MAGGAADLIDLEHNRIFIAVDQDLFDDLTVAGFFALLPEFAAAAGPVGGIAALKGFVPGFFVDVRQHQHIAGLVVLRDRGDQTVAFFEIEFDHFF